MAGREQAEEKLRVSRHFLEIANQHTAMTPLLEEFVAEVRRFSGCAAVGIRIVDAEGNIPYQAYDGFSREFYELESPLSTKTDRCMCINVITGTTDPELPFYTEGGSFYMNGTTRFLATVSEEVKGQTRNVCNRFGYESVALVPIRLGERILGLIHLADPHEDMAPLGKVEALEEAAERLGAAIQRVRTEEQLWESSRELTLRNRIAEVFLTVPDPEMYGEVLDVILEAAESRYGVFGYIDEHGDLVCASMTRDVWDKCQVPDKDIVFPHDTWGGIWGRSLEERQTLYSNNPLPVPEGHLPILRVLVVPIIHHGGVIGILEVANKTTDYDEKDISLLETIANKIAPLLAARLERDRQDKERQRAEEVLHRYALKLGKRVRELNCLYEISTLVEQPDSSLEEILQATTELIPPAYQYPEVSCARIILDAREFRTENFQESLWKQDTEIVVDGQQIGTLEVCCREEKPESDEGPFLKEERDLINAIGERLGRTIERKRSEAERNRLLGQLEEEQGRLQAVLLQMPAGVIIAEAPSGALILANKQLEEIFRHSFLPATSIEQYTQYRLYRSDGRPYRPEEYPLARSIRTGEVVTDEESEFERGDGTRGIMAASSGPIRDQEGNIIAGVATFRDVTTRRRMQQALRRSHNRLEARVAERTAELAEVNELLEKVFSNIHILVAYLDREFNFIRVNRAYAEAGGHSPEFFLGKNHFALYPNEENEALFRKVVETGEPCFVYEKPFEYPDQPERGVTYWDWSVQPVRESDGTVSGVVLCVRDVTERHRAQESLRSYQEELRSLASQLSLTEQQERRRIASALHDNLGQLLALSKIKLGEARGLAASGAVDERLHQILEFIEGALAFTRSLTFELSPALLYQVGLVAAVEGLAEQMQKQHGLQIEVVDDGKAKPLDEDLRVVFFQSVRELLINVVKHAYAQRAKVTLARQEAHVMAQVEDDGVGFDPSVLGFRMSESAGFGLFSIRERLGYLGGRLEVRSAPDQGTVAVLTAPLAQRQAGEGR